MSFLDTVGDNWTEQAEEGGDNPEVEAKPETEQPKLETEGEQAESEEETPEDKDGKFDPDLYRKMKDERRKRQEAEAELIELRRQREKPVEARKPEPIPDAYEKPDEFNAYLDQRDFNVRAETSGIRAEIKYGEPTVKAATEWALAQNDPSLGLRVRQSASPVELVVQEYQRSRTLETIGSQTPEEFARAYAEQQGWIVSPESGQPAPKSKPSSPLPPRSLASKPGSGGIGQAAKDDGFGEIFSSVGMGLKRS